MTATEASRSRRAPAEEFLLLGPEGSAPFRAASLESELRTLWKKATVERGGEGGAVYRAALANLVVPVTPSRHEQLAPVLTEVTRRHPSRLFLIEVGAAQPSPGIHARLAALCHLREGGGGLVCSEQIILRGDTPSGALVPSAVRALLVGDLPVILLDFQVEPGLAWMEELIQMADLVLEDSCLRERLEEEQAVWRLLEREGTGRIHDLAWARLTPWREILADAFDTASTSPSLATIREVTLDYGDGGAIPSPVWLLSGWLAARLSWEPAGFDAEGVTFRSSSGGVRLRFRRDPAPNGRGLRRIRLRADQLDLEVSHTGHDATASILTRLPHESRREAAFNYRPFAACILGEIHRHEPNPSLESAARMAGLLSARWAQA